MEYYILDKKLELTYCILYDLPVDMKEIHRPAIGIRMGNYYREGQAFKLTDKDVVGNKIPVGLKIGDVIYNTLHYLMVSKKLKELLDKHSTAKIEFLRFTILDPKEKVVSEDCYIANVLEIIDCVDKKKTKGVNDPVNKGEYQSIKRLFLSEAKIPKELNIFRIASKPSVIIIREDLKKVMENENITGALFHKMGDVNIR